MGPVAKATTGAGGTIAGAGGRAAKQLSWPRSVAATNTRSSRASASSPAMIAGFATRYSQSAPQSLRRISASIWRNSSTS